MLIKPFPHGKGDGKKPVCYLVRHDYNGRKECPTIVLRGDPDMTRALIDSIDREWKYTAGGCSWGPEDRIAPEKENELMDRFETVAFAGMQPDQYNILWVRHSHAGHHELHFVIPRMELSTGKAINAYIKAKVENGAVRDRADVVTALREAGLDINREGKGYITIMDPESREKIRLKGGVYGTGWTLEKFGRPHAGEGRTGTDIDGERFQGAIALGAGRYGAITPNREARPLPTEERVIGIYQK